MKNIVVVAIGTSCCSNGLFFQSNLYDTTKKEASLNGLPRFPSVISTKKKNNDYFQFISEGRNLTTLKTD